VNYSHVINSRVLSGPDAHLGRVPAADVAKLLLGIDRVVARAAALALGRSTRGGRRARAVQLASRVTLLGLEEGSVISVLELPEHQSADDPLNLKGMQDLTDVAMRQVLRSAKGDRGAHPLLIRAVAELTDELAIGERYDALFIETEGLHPERVVITGAGRQVLQSFAEHEPPAPLPEAVSGILVEADFENNSARLRTPRNQRIEVTFLPDFADAIQMALRNQAELVGDVTFDPRTSAALSIVLRRITSSKQLELETDERTFWHNPTVGELQEEQGVGVTRDRESLKDRKTSREEADKLLLASGLEGG
jgi:hypothetical protein